MLLILSTAKKIGTVSDLELDLREGKIDAIVVPYNKKFGWLGGGTEIVIPWRNIVKIGADVVLVLVEESRTYRVSENSEHLR